MILCVYLLSFLCVFCGVHAKVKGNLEMKGKISQQYFVQFGIASLGLECENADNRVYGTEKHSFKIVPNTCFGLANACFGSQKTEPNGHLDWFINKI
ncbi:hypothetical protein ACB092_06G142300 [Castanea dentata]